MNEWLDVNLDGEIVKINANGKIKRPVVSRLHEHLIPGTPFELIREQMNEELDNIYKILNRLKRGKK